ncbi:hypothetical protein BA768_13895 [Chryseobacterium sp. CBo1]|uniref:hypothetical protein n=1 Tax=Chryseobacterium sp. CBo1 TaxID=1869230 RepID=UPI000810A642|nr:hypothetical protein [Chryseobacterium sp. CBo1]OCK52018.1 hypothetical protein BA768_13895 [Chryseobacterium sp. CBo1]
MKIYILFIFLGTNFSSQNKINIEQQCKSLHDSVFKDFFGDKFYKKNIKYNKKESYIDLHLTNNIENDDNYKIIFLNLNNENDIKMYRKEYPKFYSSDFYVYNFFYRDMVFYHKVFTCELVKNKDLIDLINKQIINYYNKINTKKYLSPKKALKIAKINGLKNICYQSLTSASSYNIDQDIWQIQDCSNEKKAKVIELNPKTGKILNIYERNYGKGEKAAYWNFFKSNDKKE